VTGGRPGASWYRASRPSSVRVIETDRTGDVGGQSGARCTADRLRTVDEQVVGFLHDVVEDTGVTLARLRSAGFTVEQVLSVDAVTKRRGETLDQSIARVVGDPSGVALRVKRADVSHNADPVRLGALDDEATRARLQEKYERTAVLLGTTLPAVLAEFGVAAE
jgi:hypothetical protein